MLKMNSMKKVFFLGVLALALWSCRPEPYKEIGDPYSVISGINGNWSLTMVEVEDRSFPQWETREFTDFFAANPVDINFDASNNSYSISASSLDGLPFSATNGQYAFDHPEFPKNLLLIAGGDTTSVELGNMVREVDQLLLFQEMKSKCDAVYARYIYTFNRN